MTELLDNLQLFFIDYYMVTEFIFCWVSYIVLVATIQLLTREKITPWRMVIAAFFLEVISFGGSIYVTSFSIAGLSGMVINNLLYILDIAVVVVAFKTYRKKNYTLVVLAAMISYIIYIGSSYLLLWIFYSVVDLSSYFFLASCVYSAVTPFLTLGIYFILKRVNAVDKVVKISHYKATSYLLILVIVVNISVFAHIVALFVQAINEAVLVNSFDPIHKYTNEMVLILFADISFTIVLIWFSSYLFMNMEKVERQKNELIQQQLYIQKLENLQVEMKNLRHDYKNIISSIYLQAKEGDISSIQDYLSSTMNHLDEQIGSSIMLSSQLANLKVMELKSLLLVKLMELETENIRYAIEIPYPIDSVKISISDFNRCLGILIDNAKEEVAKQQ
ncbi:hypothetical protein BAU15_08280 [Enterococcus sp. JM4C]|uniref:hypothetical protein n=1 Tax=Candidatus Enterococcus huntleyi TaxID=1857217 RepID=UPI00137960D4|nr:hypothetical protein [Enterococcus sp. JM4C]KAF1297892.1 hypothetical protein BAU15_08280 [Enterococcus sp. JM4C]